MQRSDTTATDSSSNQSAQETQPPSSIDPSTSTNPAASDPATSSQSRPGTASGPSHRKRRVPDSVTPNACTNCKKARAKCDGATPVCRRCSSRQIQDSCHYEIHAKTAKEQMLKEIQRLQRKNAHLESEKYDLGEKNSWIEQIMVSLKDNHQASEIIDRLKRGQSHKDIVEWLGRPLVGGDDNTDLSPTTEHQVSRAIEQYHRGLVENNDPRYWTNVTSDPALIEHLITLYLTWIHPVHMLFDERHFLHSFKQCSDVYCSASLVNVICAMSCHLLHETWDDDEQTKAAIDSLRNQFLDESQQLMKNAELRKMTSIQTYAIMFLVEMGSGHGLIGTSHLRLAVETLVEKQSSEQSSESEEVAAWGILTLQTTWAGLTYQKPNAPVSTHATPFASNILGVEDGSWRLYQQPGDSGQPERHAFSVMTASEQAKLLRVVHEMIVIYCGGRGKVAAGPLLSLYERFLDWKEDLPSELQDTQTDALPHVLFLHIQYHTAVIQLFQPLLHLSHMQQDFYNQLQGLIVRHARIGLDLLAQYRNTYSNFYLSPIQLFCLVHACDAVLRYDGYGNATPQTIEFCLSSLKHAKAGYPVAGTLQKMFRLALTDYSIPVSDEFERLMDESMRIGPEELLDACGRASYRQPVSQILVHFEQNAGQEFMAAFQDIVRKQSPQARERSDSSTSSRHSRVEIGSLLNPP